MLFFTKNNAITLIQRQVYTGNKSTLTTVGVTTNRGYLRPLSAEQASANGMQYGQAYELITEVGIDIQTGDKLTIDGGAYTVRGVANHNRGGLTAYKKYLLTNPEL
jgi:hypothetical protein